jgi:sugar (pentulose or hexulose) kinase
MKKQIILLCALFMSMQQFIAQTAPSEKMEGFVANKAENWQASYEKKDAKTYAKLLKEYIALYNGLDSISKQEYLGFM